MATRKTIYLNSDAEAKLRELLEFAQSEPAIWSMRMDMPAPTSANQLITQLIHHAYELIIQPSSQPNLAEAAPIWETPSNVLSDIPLDIEHYHVLLAEEARRQGVSIYEIIHQWRGENHEELPPLEEDPLWGMVGIGNSGLKDVSERHDDYLVEARLARRTNSSDSDNG